MFIAGWLLGSFLSVEMFAVVSVLLILLVLCIESKEIKSLFFLLIIYICGFYSALSDQKSSIELPDNYYQINRILKHSDDRIEFIGQREFSVLVQCDLRDYQDVFLVSGDIVEIQSTNLPLTAPSHLETFNYIDYLLDLGIDSIQKCAPDQILVKARKASLGVLAQYIKHHIIHEILSNKVNGLNEKGLLLSLLIGDKSFVKADTKELYKNSGVIHVLAISGMHVGIVYLVLFFIVRKVFRMNKWMSFFLIVVLLGVYILISGSSPSVVRSSLFLLMVQLGSLLHSKTDSLNLIFGVALLMLFYNSELFFEIGFQLSFCAVLGILITLGRFKKKFKYKITTIVITLLKVNIGAFLFTLPLISFHFGVINFTSIWASFIVVPIIGLVLYLGLMFLVFCKVEAIGDAIIWAVIRVIQMVQYVLENIVEISFLQLEYKMNLVSLLFFYGFLLFVFTSRKLFLGLSVLFIVSSCFFVPAHSVTVLDRKSETELLINNVLYHLGKNDTLFIDDEYFVLINNSSSDVKNEKEGGKAVFFDPSGTEMNVDSTGVENYRKFTLDF